MQLRQGRLPHRSRGRRSTAQSWFHPIEDRTRSAPDRLHPRDQPGSNGGGSITQTKSKRSRGRSAAHRRSTRCFESRQPTGRTICDGSAAKSPGLPILEGQQVGALDQPLVVGKPLTADDHHPAEMGVAGERPARRTARPPRLPRARPSERDRARRASPAGRSTRWPGLPCSREPDQDEGQPR